MRRLLVSALLVACCGCSTMSNTEKGALGGGALGAGLGAVVGNALGNTGAGAAIGGAAGLLAGGATGHAIDRAEENAVARASATQVVGVPAGQALTIQDVATMSLNNAGDAVIINQIRNSGAVFNLTPSDISYLKSNRVSDVVITEMQSRYPQAVVAQPVVVRQPPPVVFIERRPPPPVGFGVIYHHRR